MIYRVTGSVSTLEPGNPLEEAFRDGAGNPAHPIEAIFPIFQAREGELWIPLGTGFFISQNGVFATARHVLTDNYGVLLNSLVGVQIIRLSGRTVVLPRRIIQADLHGKADVAVGMLENPLLDTTGRQILNSAFMLTDKIPAIGNQAVTYAIPQPKAVPGTDRKFELQFVPRLIYGEVQEYFSSGRDQNLPGKCYQTSLELKGGASGGPVFFGDGRVFSVNSTGFDFPLLAENETGDDTPVSYVSSINDIFDLQIKNIRFDVDGKIRKTATIGEMSHYGYVNLDDSF